MANVELKPARVFEQFAKINQIPRPSKHEEQMIAYLQKFAEERGLAVKVDKTGNVLISKPATKGMEKVPTVVLQSHMDMVCDKLVDVDFDFLKDAIQTSSTRMTLSTVPSSVSSHVMRKQACRVRSVWRQAS